MGDKADPVQLVFLINGNQHGSVEFLFVANKGRQQILDRGVNQFYQRDAVDQLQIRRFKAYVSEQAEVRALAGAPQLICCNTNTL